MNDVFTEYVRSLAAGNEPERSSCDEVWEHLRALLVTEMRRRSLWTAPPDHLGVTAASWRESGALDELVADAYEFVFLRRLRGLANQLEIRDNIRGLIVRNVRNFLSDRQRKADPIGYRVFSRLRKALEGLIATGQLILRGWGSKMREAENEKGSGPAPPPIDNGSILGFGAFPAPLADIDSLIEPASRWNDQLMPELITAEGSAVREVVEDLADHAATLPEDGVKAFRFGHLAKALKDDARARWQAIWEHLRDTLPEDGEPGAQQVPVVHPDATSDWRQLQAVVLACIETTIGSVTKAKWQRDLWTVWLYVRSTRVDTDEPRDLPTFSQASRELGLPRERVSQLLDQLRQWARACLACDGLCTARSNQNQSTDDSVPAAQRVWGERQTR